MEEKFLSVDDICKYLGIGRDTIYKWIADKGLPAYRLGRLWKFKKKEVDEWAEKNAWRHTKGENKPGITAEIDPSKGKVVPLKDKRESVLGH
jgi:excisionase family DNA binding protein